MGWTDDVSLATALRDGLKTNYPGFVQGTIPQSPLSRHSEVNTLYYSPHALLSHNFEERINFCNLAAQAIFGYTADEAIGMLSLDLVPEGLKQGREKLFETVIHEQRLAVVETKRITKPGRIIDIRAHVFPYELQPGKHSIAAVVEMILDG
mgnify:CR=1 FL=1